MGQTSSSDNIPESISVDSIQDEFMRRARNLTGIATLSYSEFQQYLEQLNSLAEKCMDAEGKQLLFAVKKGTDSSLLWKGMVRIVCIKIDPETKEIESYRLLTLNQFLRVFRSLNSQFMAAQEGENVSRDEEAIKTLNTSAVLKEVDSAVKVEVEGSGDEEKFAECCICLERMPDIVLPCMHSYCNTCISKWNVDHKTCPLCREALDSGEEGWVISEAPNSLQIGEEICASLMELMHVQQRSCETPD